MARNGRFWERWGAVGALAAILALMLGGGLYLQTKLSEIRAEIPLIEATKLRDGFIALGDLIRLENAVNAATESPRPSPEARQAISRALDFVFVRSQQFGKLGASSVAVEDSVGIEETLQRIVEAGDQALAGDAGALRRYERVLDEQASTFRGQLVRYTDAQHQAQSAATAEQSRLLERMTVASAVLLLVFGLVASAAVLLLRAELRANRRRMAAEEQARFLSYHDPLTGLLNRTKFHESGGTILVENEDPLILLLDLDDFKSINDSHGHAAGDAVLSAVAERLQRHAAGLGGVAARLGGDELAAMLPGPFSPEESGELARTLLATIRAPVQIDGLVLAPDASIGLCRRTDLPADQAATVSGLLKAADLALYEAKQKGSVAFVLHDPELAVRARERQEILLALPKAIEDGDVYAVFQPQVDLESGRMRGVEALARWRRGDETLLPQRFIPIAEESGIIVALDRHILRQATATVAGWTGEGTSDLFLSVNLSPLNFRDESIVEEVQDALVASGLPKGRLVLEITETAFLDSSRQARATIARLHELGVSVALDDFGTGYSTLGSLKELPVDAVKIDRSFLARLEEGEEAEIILRALTGMAQRLGLSVTLEGVETEAQRMLAQKLGCDTVQGFYYDRPMEAEALLRRFAPAEAASGSGRGNGG